MWYDAKLYQPDEGISVILRTEDDSFFIGYVVYSGGIEYRNINEVGDCHEIKDVVEWCEFHETKDEIGGKAHNYLELRV